MDWTISRRTGRETGIPRGLPYLTGFVTHCEIEVEAFDWNCPQFITPRFTAEEVREAIAPQLDTIEALKAENETLKARLAALQTSVS